MVKKEEIKDSIECYKRFLGTIIIDKSILDDILAEIDSFFKNGYIFIDGNNLSGKMMNKNGNDYLKISYEHDCLNCHYTKYNSKFIFNVVQSFSNGHTKLDRYENIRCKCEGNHSEGKIIQSHRIYDDSKRLIFESLMNQITDYDVFGSQIQYGDDSFNKFDLLKKWYFLNGSIIAYNVSKNYFADNSGLKEKYTICEKPWIINYVMRYDFENLDEELFKKLMLGQMTIEDVIRENKILNEQKVIGLDSYQGVI